jgi:hypothetical protein
LKQCRVGPNVVWRPDFGFGRIYVLIEPKKLFWKIGARNVELGMEKLN